GLPPIYEGGSLVLGLDGVTPQVVDDSALGGPVYQVPVGWSEIPSRPLDTHLLPAEVGETLVVDIFLPNGSPWPGTIQFSGDVVAAGVGDTYFGHVDLGSLPRGEWVAATVAIPPAVLSGLRTNNPRAQIRTFINTGLEGVMVRGLRAE